MSARRDDRRDEDLTALLGELETTLGRLREELAERERADRAAGERSGDREYGEYRADRDWDARRPLPEPPSVGDVARFTSDYTIPTVVAVLEATIRALELVGSLLRLLDPEGSLGAERDRGRGRGRTGGGVLDGSRARPALDRTVDSVGGAALDGLDRALSELERALTEADLPEDPDARSIVEEARDLTAEVEARIADAERARGRDRDRDREDTRTGGRTGRGRTRERSGDGDGRGSRDADRRERRDRPDDGAIRIVVDEEADDPGRDAVDGADTDEGSQGDEDEDEDDDRSVEVDVEAELESIREEVRGGDEPDATADDAAADAGDGDGGVSGTGDGDGDRDGDAEDEDEQN